MTDTGASAPTHLVGGAEPAADAPPARTGRSRVRQVISALISLAIVVAIFSFFLPAFADISSVWASIRGMTSIELSTLALAAIWNLLTYGLLMVATMPGLTFGQAMVVTEASTAVSNTVPAGGAIGIGMNFAMYTSWGFSRSRATVSLLLSGLWNNFAKLGLPVLALALLALQGRPSSGRVIAGVLGIAGLLGAIAIFAAMLRSDAAARRFGEIAGSAASAVLRVAHRPPVTGWEMATAKFRSRTVLLLRARWLSLTLTTVTSHLSLYLVLLLALRHMGVSNADVNWAEVLAVFAFARLVTAIPLTPGGLGIVELALITGLSAAGGPRAEVAAAVLVFRALTYVLPIPLGLGCYLYWRRNTSWRRPPGMAPRTELVPETSPSTGSPADPGIRTQAAPAPKTRAPGRPRYVRPAREMFWMVGGTAVLLLSAASVHQHSVDSWERSVFEVVNDSVTVPFALVWPIMQLGNIVAVPVAALGAAIARRIRLAGAILVGGALTYYLAKVVKRFVVRGRPPDLLPDVQIAGTAAQGLGFVSGHAGVSALLATVALPYLGRRLQALAIGLAAFVCLARMYVGAHLPLDILGGAALGAAVGAGMRMLFGRPVRCS